MTTCERLSLRIALSGRTVLATGTFSASEGSGHDRRAVDGVDAEISHFAPPGWSAPRSAGVADFREVEACRSAASVTLTFGK